MNKRNLLILFTLTMSGSALWGMQELTQNNNEALQTILDDNRELFHTLFNEKKIDLNERVNDEQGRVRPLWEIIREMYPETEWIKELHTYEAQIEDSPELRLCKACADLDSEKIRALLTTYPTIDVNFSQHQFDNPKKRTLTPLMLLLKFSHIRYEAIQRLFSIDGQLSKKGRSVQEAIIQKGAQGLKLLLHCPRLDISTCVDHTRGGPLHAAVTSPHLLKILLNACNTGKIALDVCKSNNAQCPPLRLAAGCNLESVKLLCAHPTIDKQFGNFAFNNAVSSPIISNLPGPLKREILYCLSDHGASVDCTIDGRSTLLGYVLQRRAQANPDAEDVDRAIVIYGLLALGASLKLGSTQDRFSDLASYEDIPGEIDGGDRPLDAIAMSKTKQLLFTSYCRRRALLGDRFSDFCTTTYRAYTYPCEGEDPHQQCDRKLRCQHYLNYIGGHPDLVNSKDALGLTPLMWAAARGDEELIKELLAMPCINGSAIDWLGNTALHYACRNGHTRAIWRLLEHNSVSIPTVNNAGIGAMRLARYNGKHDVFEKLRERRYEVLKTGLREGAYRLPSEVLRMVAEYLHL